MYVTYDNLIQFGLFIVALIKPKQQDVAEMLSEKGIKNILLPNMKERSND